MLDWVMAAGFEDIIEANEISFDVGVRMIDAVANTSLSGEVDDDIELVFLEKFVDEFFVGKVAFDESEVFEFLELF